MPEGGAQPDHTMSSLPRFDDDFRRLFRELIAWRRDVRRFQTRPLADGLLDALLDIACLAPSVGNSQPWRFVVVNHSARRALIRQNFERCNATALAAYSDDRAALYAKLKLAGLSEAPSHVAVFVDETTSAGHQLGRQTMPETLQYSALTAVRTLWLAARAHGVGVRAGSSSHTSASAIRKRSISNLSWSAVGGRRGCSNGISCSTGRQDK